jgi:hypothetical protein
MVYAECKMLLIQEYEEVKHINLELIRNFINALHNTRRVMRDLKKFEKQLRYPYYAYGSGGKFYYLDGLEKSMEDYNESSGPSLWLPFYIDKEFENNKTKYYLKIDEMPNCSLKYVIVWFERYVINWLIMNNISLIGELKVYDDEDNIEEIISIDNKIYKSKTTDPEVINSDWWKEKNIDGWYNFNQVSNLKLIKEKTIFNNLKYEKFPKLFEFVSEDIENGILPPDFDFKS